MIQKYQFTQQRNLAREAREFLEKKLNETDDEEMKARIAPNIIYCQACEEASALIVELLEANEKKAAEKKEAEKKAAPKEEAPKKKRAPKKPAEEDDLEDLF